MTTDAQNIFKIAQMIDQAEKAFRAHEAEAEQALAAMLAEAKREQKEARQRLVEWLKTIMPEQMIEFIDLTTYSENAAKKSRDQYHHSGTRLKIELPRAMPIRFNVWYLLSDFKLVDGFHVATDGTVKDDDFDSFYISYYWGRKFDGDAIMVAAGCALVEWQEHGRALEKELAAKIGERKRQQETAADQADRPAPAVPVKEKTTREILSDIGETLNDLTDNLGMIVDVMHMVHGQP